MYNNTKENKCCLLCESYERGAVKKIKTGQIKQKSTQKLQDVEAWDYCIYPK